MKAHVWINSQTKLIYSVVETAANVADSAVLPELLHGDVTTALDQRFLNWSRIDGLICRKRLKALPRLLVASQSRLLWTLLLAMSAATIDRQLLVVSEQAYGRRKKKAAKLNHVHKMVPIRTCADWGDVNPSHLEVDS